MEIRRERLQQIVKLDCSEDDEISDLYLHIVQMFGSIEKTTTGDVTKLQLLDDVEIELTLNSIVIEWTKDSMVSETVADSIIIMTLGLQTKKKNVLSESKLEERDSNAWKVHELQNLFQEQFGDCFSAETGQEEGVGNGSVTIGKSKAIVDFSTMKLIDCNSNPLRGRVESILSIGQKLTTPLC
ncbi:hypothetical protein SEUBUCD646_0H02210 [Saccharomyces eubayanus]|uniref:Pre-mRNA 3'-end-processing endonuclease polyadenylation factor C-term domain-containing protein n=2 Tax=Saccharomyces TaxID=4930 RepID=A0A6C1E9C9_SACPS|nr:hypothetical protein GRS66_008122 [Saccharomyces pastorianus]CAI2026295.1 hypothetical protein SEUBUCD650_0H02220 [Saccharomyces eubayanus]CAI2040745.1 hypothetical protein SEUBUCD646_0H02210 [Saccharomyces eubayanus]